MGVVHLHPRTPFPYLGNGWTNVAKIWCVARGPLPNYALYESHGV